MESVPEVCRLCLELLVENASSSIEEPTLKAKMEQVFNFPVEPKPEHSSQVCLSCVTFVSEFYEYSDQVWQNQNRLPSANVKCDVSLEDAVIPKVEPTSEDEEDTGEVIEDGTEGVVVPKDEQTLEAVDAEENEEGFSVDEIFLDAYEPPAGRSKRISARKSRMKRERKPSVEDEDFGDGNDSDYKTPMKKQPKKVNRKLPKEYDEEYGKINDFYEITCEFCGQTETTFSLLLEHFKREHDQPGYLVCCEKKFFSRKFLYEHMMMHTNPDAYRCEICNKTFKRKDYLLDHNVNKHSKEEDRPFKCDQCHQSFNKDYKLRIHKRTHEKAQCTICDKECASKYSLKAHIANMHTNTARRMICDTCGREFKDKNTFERHVNKHAGIETVEKLPCPICNALIRGKHGLQRHILHMHEESGKQFICDICGKHSNNSSALDLHKRAVHCELKYACEFCDAKFKMPLNLKEHRATHTGEVLYSCEYCDKTTNSRANHYVHIKKNHPVQWAMKKEQGISSISS